MFIERTDAEAKALTLRPPDVKNQLIGKDPDAGKDWGLEKGMTEDDIVEWHHWFNGHDFEQAPGVGDGQGSLVRCSPCGRKESDTTEQLNWGQENRICLNEEGTLVAFKNSFKETSEEGESKKMTIDIHIQRKTNATQ